MDQEEKGKLLDRMRRALKDARTSRKFDRKMTCIAQGDVLCCGSESDIDMVQDYAKSRGMLPGKNEAFADKYMLKNGAINLRQREKYNKRPAVRAIKKSRSKDAGLSI